MAVPLLGLLFRVVTDPQTFPYYDLGPLVGAFAWDLSRKRPVPMLTMAVAVVEFGGLRAVPYGMPWIRLVLVTVCVGVVLRDRSAHRDFVSDGDLAGLHNAGDDADALVMQVADRGEVAGLSR
jgi:hypothetical protein